MPECCFWLMRSRTTICIRHSSCLLFCPSFLAVYFIKARDNFFSVFPYRGIVTFMKIWENRIKNVFVEEQVIISLNVPFKKNEWLT